MTLAEVHAELVRRSNWPNAPVDVNQAFGTAAALLRGDPDFALRERIEAFVAEHKDCVEQGDCGWLPFAQKLLNPPNKEGP